MLRSIFLSFFCILFMSTVAAASSPAPKVGDTYEITKDTKTSYKSANGSGSSGGKTMIIERVIALRDDGLELEYNEPPLPASAKPVKIRPWQFPARVFKPSNRGPLRLLNSAELEARIEVWLKDAGVPRSSCGKTVFTWNAFRIECDPQSMIKTIESFDLGSATIGDGVAYNDADALAAGKLVKKDGPEGVTYSAEMPVDPAVIRRERAEADVTVGEMMRQPVTLEEALARREKENVTGTISVVFEADAAGNIHRRTKVKTLDIKAAGDESETRKQTEILERRSVTGP